MMNLRDEYLAAAGGVIETAAANAAIDLMRGDKPSFHRGYTRENAAIAVNDVLFPEVSVERIEECVAMREQAAGVWEEA
jgi:hypothetical protein